MPVPRSLRRRSQNKPGKQPGDPGTTLCQTPTPDQVIDHYPHVCGGCDRPLRAARPAGVRACQVFDLPEPVGLEVTEHRYHRLRCTCGHTTAPDPLPGAGAPACYDLHLKRGREAMDAFKVLPALNGVLVTDALGSYTAYGGAHQLC